MILNPYFSIFLSKFNAFPFKILFTNERPKYLDKKKATVAEPKHPTILSKTAIWALNIFPAIMDIMDAGNIIRSGLNVYMIMKTIAESLP
jgi:hypothetical protein